MGVITRHAHAGGPVSIEPRTSQVRETHAVGFDRAIFDRVITQLAEERRLLYRGGHDTSSRRARRRPYAPCPVAERDRRTVGLPRHDPGEARR